MDKRKNNGGNSTKAKGIDKRKNEYKIALQEASTIDEVKDVICVLKEQSKGGDIQAIKLFLAYYLGNPKDTLETINHDVSSELTIEEIKLFKEQILGEY